MGQLIISVIVILFVTYWALGTVLYLKQPTFLYKPVRDVPYTPDELGLDFDDVILKAADGVKLSGWYIPGESSQFTVLFCHGNGGNIMHRLDTINIINELGLNCLIFDYRGYGHSEGKTTEEGTYLDVAAAYNWLIKEKKVKPDKIILFGRSLGASIASQLASTVDVRALIIESAFTSYVDMGKKFYPYMPVQWFAKFSYNTLDYIKKIYCPVMIIHSRMDEIVPFEFGLKLHEAANEPKEFIEITGGHNDGFIISGELYKKALRKWIDFLKEHEILVSQQAS